MKKFVRTLEFYGYVEDNNMRKDDEKLFPISGVKEIKNRKYVLTEKKDEENNDEESTSGETQG